MVSSATDAVLEMLRSRGLRMTPQRRAIVSAVMGMNGHINASAVTKDVRQRVPGVNASTVYRTLEMLERLGVLSHAHLESGPEYHRRSDSAHVHLVCSRCGAGDSLTIEEADRLERLVSRHHGFRPDLTHFAISGLCSRCQRGLRRRAR